MRLRIAGVVNDSIVDGPGLRFTIFTQGCPHHCKGCHNLHTHDYIGGKEIDTDELYNNIVANKILTGVTYSGGEPFEQVAPLLELARRLRADTGLNIVVYTGYTIEQLVARGDDATNELLSLIYLLIDGKYDESLRNLELEFRGSSNQRLIYMSEYYNMQ